MGSRIAGGSESVSDRLSSRSSYTGACQRIGWIGGFVLSGQHFSAAAYGRAFAVSKSDFGGVWPCETPSASQKRTRPAVQTCPQTTTRSACRRRQEGSRFQRQSAEGYHVCVVRTTEGHQAVYSKIAYRPTDKHFSFGAAQRHLAQSTNTIGTTYPQCIALDVYVGMGVVAVAGCVQLAAAAWFAGGQMSRNGAGTGQARLVDAGIYSLSNTCQRPAATVLGRTVKNDPRISPGCVFT